MLSTFKNCAARLRCSVCRPLAASRERGDVPGWVLVAVMTAGLVTAIWLIADDALTSIFDRAISSISIDS